MSITTILTRTFNNIYIVMYLYGVGLIASNLVGFVYPLSAKCFELCSVSAILQLNFLYN